jgi:hypothetical protein
MPDPHNDYIHGAVDGRAYMVHKDAASDLDRLINAAMELSEHVRLLKHDAHQAAVVVEMHPASFRNLMFHAHAFVDPGLWASATSKLGELTIYDVTFRAVPPRG